MKRMNTIKRIRREVFGLTQKEFAELAGVRQATVSRWEAGELSPDLTQLSAIRQAVIEKGTPWEDAWFFEPHTEQTNGGIAEVAA